MKRSQVLGTIWDILYKETAMEEESLHGLSVLILDTIEDMGMLPPERSRYMATSGDYIGEDTSWEPEDEKK